jgi:hypothetical protein
MNNHPVLKSLCGALTVSINVQFFNQQQKNQFDIWVLHAVVANDLSTDDSFVVSIKFFFFN